MEEQDVSKLYFCKKYIKGLRKFWDAFKKRFYQERDNYLKKKTKATHGRNA